MYPAPSVIIFTVLSGLGFGYLAFLAVGAVRPAGWAAFGFWGIGYTLAVGGLLASAAHLGNPQRALLAFTQWRSSWLSREAWASVAALLALAPVALSDWLGLGWPRIFGFIGAALCVMTVLATAMIYTQIRAVPRWNNATVPAVFAAFSLAGGAILAGQVAVATGLLALAGLAMVAHWRIGDAAFARAGSTLGTATGLGAIGRTEVFEQPHTGGNYLLREMIYVVACKHVPRLRAIALGAGIVLPAFCLWTVPNIWGVGFAVSLHLVGVFAQRWLFFAQAEHVVGLYYGKRAG
jgi:DMSO reductase anchor subunit